MKHIKIGNVISIPFSDKYFITAKIIWISGVFKDVMGFVLLPTLYESGDNPKIIEGEYIKVPIYTGDISVIYGDIKNVYKGDWELIGDCHITQLDEDLLYHNIGGSLYKGDELIRELKDEELFKYPKFLNAGNKAIEKMLCVAFGTNQ